MYPGLASQNRSTSDMDDGLIGFQPRQYQTGDQSNTLEMNVSLAKDVELPRHGVSSRNERLLGAGHHQASPGEDQQKNNRRRIQYLSASLDSLKGVLQISAYHSEIGIIVVAPYEQFGGAGLHDPE